VSEIDIPSDWCHKEKASLVIHIVSKESRSGVDYYIDKLGHAYLESTLRGSWRPVDDAYAIQKAWAKKHGIIWRDA
jgi:hypothetical protein